MAVSKAEILDAIASMTVLDLSELIKEMEEKFGVSAAAAAVAVAAPAAAGAAAAEEQTEFTVMLNSCGEKKVEVIKVVRAATGLGLGKPRTWSTAHPRLLKKACPRPMPMR
jgi:large subunit ribosomal protein L7/L12